jgi:hypothetical protein
MAIDALKKAFMYTLRGDFGTVWTGAQRKLENQILNTFEYIRDEESPSWLRSKDNLQTFHLTESEYATLFSDSDGSRFTIDTEKTIRAIEVPIVAPDKAHSVQISQSNNDSAEQEKEFQIQLEPSYDYPPALWRTLPVSEDGSATNVQVNIDRREPQLNRFLRTVQQSQDNTQEANTAVGLPAVVPTEEQPPVFLISIDTLRYDQQEELSSLIDELGPNAIFPTEPRTQGTWTPPSHASMFTGTHPGEHGYVGYGKGPGDKRPINPDLTTIPELLAENGYKNSALVSHSRILPEFGFGRGFHRFCHDGMSYSDWVTRNNDAKASVNQVIDWIEQDLAVRDHSLFYFLHVFDPHYPYIPPAERLDSPDVDFSKSQSFRRKINDAQGDDWTYLDGCQNKYELEPELVQEMREWYSKSVEYTGDQIVRFLQYLKAQDLFKKSLIIITGDHGEEFGERGFFTHTSLYDGNIRPFMAVKPPVSESWPQRDRIDTIDFLPTIARLAGEDVPEYSSGTPIQSESGEDPRIIERIYADWYSLAVEVGEIKGIFTYDSNYPDRPTQDVIQEGPKLKEFYELSDVRKSDYRQKGATSGQKNKVRQIAEEFLLDKSTSYEVTIEATRPSQETIEQLQNLGYK